MYPEAARYYKKAVDRVGEGEQPATGFPGGGIHAKLPESVARPSAR